MAVGQQAADRRQLAALNFLLPAAGCPLLAVSEGGGPVLWIMVSPGRGLSDKKSERKRMNTDVKGELHGEDHPGNQ
jgi:hypothetical protein